MNTILESNQIIVGLNWGAILEDGWFNSKLHVGIDLDLCCFLIDNSQNLKDLISLENPNSIFGELSKDDMEGDMDGNDQRDNEWLIIDLNKINTDFELHISISNYSEKSLKKISHLDYRIYSGKPNQVIKRFYFKDLKKIELNNTTKGIYLGKIKNNDGVWSFNNSEIQLEVCEPTQQIEQILSHQPIK